MKRRIVAFAMFIIVTSILCVPMCVAVQRAMINNDLSFNGTMAICSAEVTELGMNISATLELWYGNNCLDSWSATGKGYVSLGGSCSVTSGLEYTQVLSGTAGGVSFGPLSTQGTCP